MDYDSKLSTEEYKQTKQEFLELAEVGGGHMDYSEIRDKILMLREDVNTAQINKMTLEIMKTYSHRPALIWELEEIKQKAEYTEWRKTHKTKRAKAKCPNCGHNSVVRIVYGMPGDESIFNAADKGQIIIGGCIPTDNKYGCSNCEAEYEEI